MSLARHSPEIAASLSTVILADDLTGACDSAAAFAARGRVTRVALDFRLMDRTPGHVFSCSLETRNLPAREAAYRMREAAERVPPGVEMLFCKIDSAGRGPFGTATLSLLDPPVREWAVVTPAYPEQGRIVRNGVLHVIEGNGTAIRHIPLATLFPVESESLLATVASSDVREPGRQIAAALNAGKRILLCDAETQDDLAALADAARRQVNRGRVLWCGSAGLARALANLDLPSAAAPPGVASENGEEGTTLLFAGTPHRLTADQMETLAGVDGVLRINCESEGEPFAPGARCVLATVKCGDTTDVQIRNVWARAQRPRGVRGLILTGGDTASLTLRALGAESILIKGEIASGIPWGVIEGGLAAGHRVVTKSGGFGGRAALADAVCFLEQRA